MSVSNFSGYAVDKPTSRVMAPPGGRGSNIFGTYEEEKKTPVTNGTNTVTNGVATTNNGTTTNGTTTNGTATNGTHPNHPTPTDHQQNQIDAASIKNRQTVGNNLFGPNTNDTSGNAVANRKKRTGYNPITGQAYDDEPATPTATPTNGSTTTTPSTPAPPTTTTPNAPTPTEPVEEKPVGKPLHTSVAIKQPPGGRSTKLW